MPRCPQCAHEAPHDSRFCPHCAHALDQAAAFDATRTSAPPRPTPTPVPRSAHEEPRFLPGTVLAGRYRFVGLLGRGGMGEVYRADDLKLGQTVALKFLPREVDRDPDRLQRFLNEVRLALRITHPNVCRVHDIGEIEGQHFISMEYVDGEDLASLLRRIGRLPEERGVEIARQICSGLAAAHEQGILHRDLKPANVMIDGRGRARITDFGLAGLVGSVEGAEARVGTPAYMAPEQLAGGQVTLRSDVYALGLVLYEVFTGKPAYAARSAGEMARLQRTAPTTPTTHVRGLDPAIEAVLLRMLETDPARRPASAVAVAAALPGGDPLAAALAAGETPSPEMVAEAGQSGAVAPVWVALCVLGIFAGVALTAFLTPRNDAIGSIRTPYSIAALRERARLMSERLGFRGVPVATARDVTADREYVDWLREDEHKGEMRARVEAQRPPVYVLWYRESPEPLVPTDRLEDRVLENDPPVTTPGMVSLRLDPQARLVSLAAVPPDREDAAPAEDEGAADASPDAVWSSLFQEAGLDRDRFTEVEPARTPPYFADARAAWEGTLAEAEDVPLRVEAAAFRGRPVSFRIIGPWTRDRGTAKPPDLADRVMPYVGVVILCSLLAGIALLARRNINGGRADLRGARRVGLTLFLLELAFWMLKGGMFLGGNVAQHFTERLFVVVFVSALVFMAYVGLEPYVRRLWPTTLISWTRLVAGRLGDPLVGRDVLIGGAFGVFAALLWTAHTRLPGLLGLLPEPLAVSAEQSTYGTFAALSKMLDDLGASIGLSMLLLVSLVLLRLLLRRDWLAIGAWFVIGVTISHVGSPHLLLDISIHAVVSTVTLFVTLRVGLVALVAMSFFQTAAGWIGTFDPSSWVWETAVVYLVGMVVAAGYATVVALGGRKLLAEDV